MTGQALAIATRSDLAALVETAGAYAAQATAANTSRAYAADWADFTAFCAEIGAKPLPASGHLVAVYLTRRADTLTTSTLERRLAGIRAAHKAAGEPMPTGPELAMTWKGIKRAHGRPPEQKRALVADDMRRVLASTPSNLAGLRDRALLLIGFGAALRRSELAALQLDAKGVQGVRVRIVSGGLEIHLDRAKGDQEGRGAVVAIPHGQTADTCAVRALRAWLDAAGIEAGPVFRSVSRWGKVSDDAMTPFAVAGVVKAAAERVGLDPADFAGHSLRAGLATSAAAADAPAELIMGHMRHKKFETTRRYIRQGEQFKRNAAGMVGL